MRVGVFGSNASELASELNANKVSSQGSATSSVSSASEDRTTFSSDATSVHSLVSTAMQSPEVRQDKVNSFRDAISSGQYKPEPAAIASSMLNEYA